MRSLTYLALPYTNDLYFNRTRLLKAYGYANISSNGSASRYDVASKIFEIVKPIILYPVDGDYFATEYFATRPVQRQWIAIKLIICLAKIAKIHGKITH